MTKGVKTGGKDFTPGNNGTKGFKPGQSGNPGGRPKWKPFTEALRRALKIDDGQQQSKELDGIAKAMLKQAKQGDVAALREIADRLEGKVPQAVTGEDGGAVAVEIVHTFKSNI